MNSNWKRMTRLILCLYIVLCQHQSAVCDFRDIPGHCEFQSNALFWCFVWVLFRRGGMLVFWLIGLVVYGSTVIWVTRHHTVPKWVSMGPLMALLRFVEMQLVSLLASINHFTAHKNCGHCAGPLFARSSMLRLRGRNRCGGQTGCQRWWISQASWCACDIPFGTCHFGPFPPLKGRISGAN